jgi:dihydroorotase
MAADLVIKNGWVVTPEATFKGGVAISNEVIVAIGTDDSLPQGKQEVDVKGKHILPGLFDGHVHFREPGMTHKEDFNTGSTAAVCGGITTVVDMPNTVPPTADAEQVKVKKELGEAKSLVDFGITGVVVQTNTKDILPMAAAGAIGYKIFFGETIGNRSCRWAFTRKIARSWRTAPTSSSRKIRTKRAIGKRLVPTSARRSRCIMRSSSPRLSAPSCTFST